MATMTSLEGDGVRGGMLVTTRWLASHLTASDVRVVDMRGQVTTAAPGATKHGAVYLGRPDAYAQGHIAGAVYLDWTSDIVDLDDPVPAQAASAKKLAHELGSRGIGSQHLVVAYDDHPAAQFATRLWWLLHYYGHSRVAVLDGGLRKWVAEGRPLDTAVPTYPPAVFEPHQVASLRVDLDEMRSLAGGKAARLIDARDPAQYSGASRRGKHGGHIAGAVNIPRELLTDAHTGEFLDDQQLDKAFRPTEQQAGQRVVAYCNGGVAATSVLFSLALRGYPLENLANYDGSWNEWGELDDVAITEGSQP